MTAVTFPGANLALGAGQDEYITLPAAVTADGIVVTCWRPSFWGCVKLLWTRRLWLHTHTFHRPFQPVILSVDQLFTMAPSGGPTVEVDTQVGE